MPLDIVHPGWPALDSGVLFTIGEKKWQVASQKNEAVWKCSTYDGERETGEFTEDQINAGRVRRVNAVAIYEWLKHKNVGDIVHHSPYREVHEADRKQPFVRCRIEAENGVAYLRPIALVGGWRDDDLPRYDYTGRFEEGRGIIADIVWKRRFPVPYPSKHGVYDIFDILDGYYEAEPFGNPEHGHPKDWEPISLEPLDRRDHELVRLKEIGAKIDKVLPRRMVRGPGLLPHPFFGFAHSLPDDEEREFGLGTSNYRDELRNTLRRMRAILNEADLEAPVKTDEAEKIAE